MNTYGYVNANPLINTDRSGLILDTLADLAFIGYDLYRIFADNIFGSCNNFGDNLSALGLDLLGAITPFMTGLGMAHRMENAATAAADAATVANAGDNALAAATTAEKSADNAPDFIVSPGGTAYPVPKGATGPTPVVNDAGNQTGVAFTGGAGGANGQVSTMRIMNPTPSKGNTPAYPNGYIKYENSASPRPQGVDPYSGKTLPNSQSHFPID